MEEIFSFLVFGIIAGLFFKGRGMAGEGDNVFHLGTDAENRKMFLPYVLAAEKVNGIPAGMLDKLIMVESGYDTAVISGQRVSSAGALGIAQIVPRWHPNVDPLNPVEAIEYAAWYLRDNYDEFGTWQKALAAYNWGPGNLREAIKTYGANWFANAPTETKNYVTAIA